MEQYFIIGMIISITTFLIMAVFVNLFLDELKKEDENVAYIDGLIVYRS